MLARFSAAVAMAVIALPSSLAPAASPSPHVSIRPFLAAVGRTITVVLASDDGSAFAIDPVATELSLRSLDRPGRVTHLSPKAHGIVFASAPPAGSPLMRLTPSTPVAALTFSLPASVGAGMYDVKVTYAGDSHLTFQEASPSQLYVSTAQNQPDGGLVEVRRDYVGKVVFLMSVTQWVNQLTCSREPQPPGPKPSSTPVPPKPSGTVSPGELMRRLREFAQRPVQSHDFGEIGALRGSAWRVLSATRLTNAQDGYFSNTDPEFLSVEPLEVSLAPLSPQASYVGGSDSAGVRAYLSSCETFVRVFADPWEVKRTLFTRSPFDHPEWPNEVQAAVRDGNVLSGMTHEMVANVFGYPSVYAPIGDLDRMTRWYYDEPAPFGPTITFRGDRVVEYDPGSAPP